MRKYFYIVELMIFFVICSNAGIGQSNVRIIVDGKTFNSGDTLFICSGTTVQYSFDYSGITDSISWTYNQGNPSTSNLKTVSVNYNIANYPNSSPTNLFIRNANVVGTAQIFVSVKSNTLSANFNTITGPVCGSDTITFVSTSSGLISKYNWDFNDGTFGKDTPQVRHAFLNDILPPNTIRTKDIKLTISDKWGCINSIIKSVLIKPVPDASIDTIGFDPKISKTISNGLITYGVCDNNFSTSSNYTFNFQNKSLSIPFNARYIIDWGDNSPFLYLQSWNPGTTISHTFSYGLSIITIKIIQASNDSCIGIKQYNVFVGKQSQITPIIKSGRNLCAGDSAGFDIANYANDPVGTRYFYYVYNPGNPYIRYIDTTEFFPLINDKIKVGINASSCANLGNSWAIKVFSINVCGAPDFDLSFGFSKKPKPNFTLSPNNLVFCKNTIVTLSNTSMYDSTVTGTNSPFNCTNTVNDIVAWEIFPNSYSLNGTLGNYNNGVITAPGTSSIQITLNDTGNYHIRLYTNGNSCGVVYKDTTICVRNPPNASFTLSDSVICSQNSITFSKNDSLPECKGESYLWSFLNYRDSANCKGSQSSTPVFTSGSPNTKTATVQMLAPGYYDLKLLALATGAPASCSASSSKRVLVKGKPIVNLISPGGLCIGDTIKPKRVVTACYDSIVTSTWSYQGGVLVNGTPSNPDSILYPIAGSYQLTTQVGSSCGVATDTTPVNVLAAPVANAGNDTTICSGDTIQLGTPNLGYNYIWTTLNGGTLLSTSVAMPKFTHINNGISNDTIFCIVKVSSGTNTKCVSFDTVRIIITPGVRLSVIVLPNDSICKGDTVTLIASGGINYTWTGSGLITNSGDTVRAVPQGNNVNNYVVSAVGAGGLCPGKAVQNIQVTPPDTVKIIASKDTVCAGTLLSSVLTIQTYPQNELYYFYSDTGLIATNTSGQVPLYNFPSGVGSVKIKVVSTNLCTKDSMEKLFIIRPSVKASFIMLPDTPTCGPVSVLFKNTSSDTSSLINFYWYVNNNLISTSTTPVQQLFTYSTTTFNDTSYIIRLKAISECDTTEYKDTLLIYARSSPRFGIDTTRKCSPFDAWFINNTLGRADSFYWNFGDGSPIIVRRDTSRVYHQYNTLVDTTFTAVLYSFNNCGKDSFYFTIRVIPNTISTAISVDGNQIESCSNDTINFKNGSRGASVLYWDFGDGTYDTTTNLQTDIKHKYAAPGVYQVKVILVNSCSSDTARLSISIYKSPVAQFLLTSTAYCTYNRAIAKNLSSGANSYSWNWGDNTPPTTDTSHLYVNAGTYNVTLTAFSIASPALTCKTTIAQPVNIIKAIPAVMNVTPGKSCAPYSFSATADNAGAATNIIWTIDTGGVAPLILTGQSASYLFKRPGNYTIKLKVITPGNCADSISKSITVLNSPEANIQQSVITTCKSDSTVTFNGFYTYTGTDTVTYNWRVNNFPAGQNKNLIYSFTAPRIAQWSVYTIELITQNTQGCADTAISNYIVYPKTTDSIIVNNVPCSRLPIVFAALSQPADSVISYQWTFGNGVVASGAAASTTFATPGSYQVQLITQTLRGCYDTTITSVQVKPSPIITVVPQTVNLCKGKSVQLLASGATNYLWSPVDSLSCTTCSNPIAKPTNFTRYIVYGDNDGCKGTDSVTVNVIDTFKLSISAVPDSICSDEYAQLNTVVTNNNGGLNYSWTPLTYIDNPNAGNVNVNPPNSMQYTVTVSDQYGCFRKDTGILISVGKKPIIDIGPLQRDITEGALTNITPLVINGPLTKYEWSSTVAGLIVDPGVDKLSIPIRQPQTIQLIGENVYRCKDTAYTTFKILCINEANLFIPNTFTPLKSTNNLFMIRSKGSLRIDYFRIFNKWGQLIFERSNVFTNERSSAWDGRLNGKLADEGVYVYTAQVKCSNGETFMRKGNIALIQEKD